MPKISEFFKPTFYANFRKRGQTRRHFDRPPPPVDFGEAICPICPISPRKLEVDMLLQVSLE